MVQRANGGVSAAVAHDGTSRRRLQTPVRQLTHAVEFILWYYYGMKIALSIPDDLFDSAENLSKRLKVSRSRLYATALEDFVAKHQATKVTERLNAVYASQNSRLDRATRRIQARSLSKNPW